MAFYIHPGIGEKFSYNRRKWQIKDLKEGVYTCVTTDDDKKKKTHLEQTFNKEDMIRICK